MHNEFWDKAHKYVWGTTTAIGTSVCTKLSVRIGTQTGICQEMTNSILCNSDSLPNAYQAAFMTTAFSFLNRHIIGMDKAKSIGLGLATTIVASGAYEGLQSITRNSSINTTDLSFETAGALIGGIGYVFASKLMEKAKESRKIRTP